jgi:multiple antibiotic resistance protein
MGATTTIIAYVLSTMGALIPIVNPFSTAPLLLSLTTSHTAEERLTIVRRACLYMFCILAAFLVAGGLIMQFFGISIPGLRIAGGLVIAFVGFRMLFPRPPPPASGDSQAAAQRDVAFTPLAMPSLAGPGSIAVVIGMSSTAQAESYVILRHALIALGIALTALFCYVVLKRASGLATRLGPAGMSALTGIMGFLLVCIGVQFIINGVSELTGT